MSDRTRCSSVNAAGPSSNNRCACSSRRGVAPRGLISRFQRVGGRPRTHSCQLCCSSSAAGFSAASRFLPGRFEGVLGSEQRSCRLPVDKCENWGELK